MPKSKVSAFFSLLLVFFSGAVLGAFAYRLYTVNPVVMAPGGVQKKGSPEDFVRQRLAEMRERVKADDQQLEQIKRVYSETHDEYERIRKEMNDKGREVDQHQVEKIKQILRPEQIPAYDQIRAEHEAARKKRQEQREREQGGRKQ